MIAESTLTPPPTNLKDGTPSVAGERHLKDEEPQRGRRRTDQELAAVKYDINRILNNDKAAIGIAQKLARQHSEWPSWTPAQQEAYLQQTVTAKIDERIAAGVHVSCKYPLFKRYAPLLNAKGKQDYKKMGLVDEQLAAMEFLTCLLYTSPSPRDGLLSRMPSSA